MPQIDKEPYFMSNQDWYEQKINEDGTYELVLTEKAPAMARYSYNEYMKKYEDLENEAYAISPGEEELDEKNFNKLFNI
jgi:hypothetical protein